ncbi:MAG: hypothetical protein IJC98_06820 [Clostridia bacterium]|nr:hypothetical protein [Clostridia bacterium]
MENDIPMLQSIRKTTQMGCYGIKTVIDETLNRPFRSALRSQYNEYEEIFNEADRLLKERGAQPKNVNPMAKMGSAMSSKMRVRTSSEPTAKIAELMLQGNTRGMIKSMHNIRTMGVLDPKVSCLSNRLLQTEQANIDQMKQYL